MDGKISISKVTGPNVRYVEIELTDTKSGIEFMHVHITLEAFAEAITGSGSQSCTFELSGMCNVGKRREVKHEFVSYDNVSKSQDYEAKAQALAPFEVDGWRGRTSDLGNMHKWNRDKSAYDVLFIRFVDAPKEA